jgi:hypothetical protein
LTGWDNLPTLNRVLRRSNIRARKYGGGGGAVEGSYPANATLDTDHDSIPNFALNATILSVATGNWSNAATWDLARVPTDDDIVGIQYPHVVTYDVDSIARIEAVGVAGTLIVKRDADTKLMCQHLIIYGSHADHGGYEGELDWGTVASPVQSGVTAEIVGLDVAIDTGTAETPGVDPEQYGNGLICFGRIRICGQTKTPFIRLADEPAATDTVLTLSGAVTGWNDGDTVVLPDSRQYSGSVVRPGGISHQWEGRTISDLTGTALTLNSALTYDHPAARESGGAVVHSIVHDVDLYPHVANVTRNVRVSSEDGTGVRWHSLFLSRADVDIRNSEWVAMGRTSNAWIESTLIDKEITGLSNTSPIIMTVSNSLSSEIPWGEVHITGATGNTAANGTWTAEYVAYNQVTLLGTTGNGTYTGGGTVTRIGTNQKGRYAVHFHRLIGPVGGQGDGRAYKFIGNSVHDPLPAPGGNTIPDSKWFLTLHGSSYGTIQNNVIHHAAGAGVMTEDGSEYENIFDGNIVMNVIGDISQRTGTATGFIEETGRSGIGFMFTGFLNRVTNNVACGCVGTYAEIVAGTGFYWNSHSSGMNVNIPDFVGADPEVDGTTVNMTYQALLEVDHNECYGGIWCFGTIWHLGTSGYNQPAQAESIIQDMLVWHPSNLGWFGYPTNKLTFDGLEIVCAPAASGPGGVSWGDYNCVDSTLSNSYLRYVSEGVTANSHVGGTFTVSNTEIESYGPCVRIDTPSVPGVAGPEFLVDSEFILDNVLLTQVGAEAGFYKIQMNYTVASANTNLRKIDKVTVIDFDQVVDDNFRVYYAEQDEDFTMPQTGGNVTQGCPDSGLTNAQAYVAYNQDGSAKAGGSLSDPTGCAIGGAVILNANQSTPRATIDGLIDEA